MKSNIVLAITLWSLLSLPVSIWGSNESDDIRDMFTAKNTVIAIEESYIELNYPLYYNNVIDDVAAELSLYYYTDPKAPTMIKVGSAKPIDIWLDGNPLSHTSDGSNNNYQNGYLVFPSIVNSNIGKNGDITWKKVRWYYPATLHGEDIVITARLHWICDYTGLISYDHQYDVRKTISLPPIDLSAVKVVLDKTDCNTLQASVMIHSTTEMHNIEARKFSLKGNSIEEATFDFTNNSKEDPNPKVDLQIINSRVTYPDTVSWSYHCIPAVHIDDSIQIAGNATILKMITSVKAGTSEFNTHARITDLTAQIDLYQATMAVTATASKNFTGNSTLIFEMYELEEGKSEPSTPMLGSFGGPLYKYTSQSSYSDTIKGVDVNKRYLLKAYIVYGYLVEDCIPATCILNKPDKYIVTFDPLPQEVGSYKLMANSQTIQSGDSVACDAIISLNLELSSYYNFEWKGNGIPLPTNPYSFKLTKPTHVTIDYQKKKAVVKVTPQGNGGALKIWYGDNALTNGSFDAEYGDTLTFEWVSEKYYRPDKLWLNGTSYNIHTSSYEIKEDHLDIIGTFAKEIGQVRIESQAGGKLKVVNETGQEMLDKDKVELGTTLIVTPYPDKHYQTSSIIVNQLPRESLLTFSHLVKDSITSFQANFTPLYYSFNIQCLGKGTLKITSNGEDVSSKDSLLYGQNIMIEAVASTPAYELKHLTINDVEYQVGSSYTIIGDTKIEAIFMPKQYSVAVACENGNITLKSNGSILTPGSYPHGTVLTAEATPYEHYQTTSFTLNGEAYTCNTEVILSEDISFAASFALIQHTVNYSCSHYGTLTVIRKDNNQEVTSGSLIDHGTVIIISATVAPNGILSGITVNGQLVSNNAEIEVSENMTIRADFFSDKLTLGINGDSQYGSIMVYSENGEVRHGDEIVPDQILTISPIPNPGYRLGTLTANSKEWSEFSIPVGTENLEIGFSFIPIEAPWSGSRISWQQGLGTESQPYEIFTPEELAYLSLRVAEGESFAGTYLKLSRSFDVSSDSPWLPIGNSDHEFLGHFNGNFQTISLLKIQSTASHSGLFGYLGAESQLYALLVENGTIDSSNPINNAGLIAGTNKGTIDQCGASGSVKSSGNQIGGLVGENRGSISHVFFIGEVAGGENTGGLIGKNNGGELSNSYSSVTITSKKATKGAIVGSQTEEIENCYYNKEKCNYGTASDNYNTTGKTSSFMKTDSFVASLNLTGSVWVSNTTQSWQGYPIFEKGVLVADKPSIVQDMSSISIWPTPAVDKLFVELKGGLTFEYRIVDLKGMVRGSGVSLDATVDVSSIESGMYILEMSLSSGDHIKKKIIKK